MAHSAEVVVAIVIVVVVVVAVIIVSGFKIKLTVVVAGGSMRNMRSF